VPMYFSYVFVRFLHATLILHNRWTLNPVDINRRV